MYVLNTPRLIAEEPHKLQLVHSRTTVPGTIGVRLRHTTSRINWKAAVEMPKTNNSDANEVEGHRSKTIPLCQTSRASTDRSIDTFPNKAPPLHSKTGPLTRADARRRRCIAISFLLHPSMSFSVSQGRAAKFLLR